MSDETYRNIGIGALVITALILVLTKFKNRQIDAKMIVALIILGAVVIMVPLAGAVVTVPIAIFVWITNYKAVLDAWYSLTNLTIKEDASE